MNHDKLDSSGRVWGNNDIGDERLKWALDSTDYSNILGDLVVLSRKHFGWFTKHTPRAFEYPWVYVEAGTVCGSNILDIGAGISPLPVLFAESGAIVLTVDNSPIVRRASEDPSSWNGWGAFDYSAISNNISSLHKNVLSAELKEKSFDCIYSVSVIEHMTANDRRDLWSRIEKWLKSDGILLLTVDLVPNTHRIWNACQGKVVETEEEHGDLDNLIEELTKRGLKLIVSKFLRDLPDCRVDVAMLHFAKNKVQ